MTKKFSDYCCTCHYDTINDEIPEICTKCNFKAGTQPSNYRPIIGCRVAKPKYIHNEQMDETLDEYNYQNELANKKEKAISDVYNYREAGKQFCKTEGSEHYKTSGVEPLDLMMSKGLIRGFALGSIIKYAARWEENGCNLNDLKKIADYAHILSGYELANSEENKNG